jgi:hypothetical protein
VNGIHEDGQPAAGIEAVLLHQAVQPLDVARAPGDHGEFGVEALEIEPADDAV